jgi:membrane-bound lytic murein transglycosylase A
MSHDTAGLLSDTKHWNQIDYEFEPLYDQVDWRNHVFDQAAYDAWMASCIYLKERGLQGSFFKENQIGWNRVIALFLEQKPREENLKCYFETNFEPKIAKNHTEPFLFTGYFEPDYEASLTPNNEFTVPLYGRPSDLILIEDLGVFNPLLAGNRVGGIAYDGTLRPYFSRKDIMEGALKGRGLELAWLRDEREAYFLSIQGSGLLNLRDGTRARVAYNGTNGHPYRSIGAYLVEQKVIKAQDISMQSIWLWGEANPREIKALFSLNPSYIFFKFLGGNAASPEGALKKPLNPLRSLAVDPRYYPLGIPLWVKGTSRRQHYQDSHQGLMFAQDTGGAIKGALRGDIFCGTGKDAGERAGGMQIEGSLTLLIPKS